ncbi:MAG: choice-of-anchor B family protein [Ignavibacteriaceae bacterium]|nr:choice-of-anchor B family protein [Ignavibacteria bacterium]NNJ53922.1 choice-of-anchor B family protein [Ignavibacteriaceae bacterium]NNL22480.1 choice-of-anchor B family protein [Ignavibacteriaceae bacterium]
MKKLVILCSIISIFAIGESVPQNVDLLGSLNPYPNLDYTDIWGYSAAGREYAFMGVTGGTSIIDVTNPASPVEVDFIAGPLAPPYEWRDIKTHLNFAYIICEGIGAGSGLQIVDLSYLPDSASLVNTYDNTFTSAHNIYIADGYAYVVGTDLGGMHILDLGLPNNPIETAYYSSSGYIHDVYVWNDTAYASSNNTYDLVDVTNKNNPQLISASINIPGTYAHSGWLTEDKRYFIATEEFNVRDILVFDLVDRSTWDLVVPEWQTGSNSPVHNVFVLDDYAHISYYEDGYVVLDISNPQLPQIAGQYDTHPGGSLGLYTGAWGVYPYLPSGNILISDMVTGLYVVKFNPPVTEVENELEQINTFQLEQNYPNPFNPSTKIKFTIPFLETNGNADVFTTLKVYDVLGNEVTTLLNENKPSGTYEVNFEAENLPSGVYIAQLRAANQVKTIKMSLVK